MRISIPGSLQLRHGAIRKKKSVRKRARKKSEIEFVRENGLLILIFKITRAQSKGEAKGTMRKNHPINLVGGSPRMADRVGKGLTTRSLLMRGLVVRSVMKRSLIDRGIIETGLNMMSLNTATEMQR